MHCRSAASVGRALLLLWMLLLGCASLVPRTVSAGAADAHTIERAYLLDGSGSMRLEDVRDAEFTPFSGFLRPPFAFSTVWLRLTIPAQPPDADPGTDGPRRLVIRVQPPHLDRVRLYDPLDADGDAWQRGRRPDTATTHPQFVVSMGPQPRNIWVSAQVGGLVPVAVDARDEAAARDRDRRDLVATAMVVGAFAGMVAWSLVNAVAQPSSLNVALFGRLALAFALMLCLSGPVRLTLVGVGNNEIVFAVGRQIAFALTAAGFWFFSRYLAALGVPRAIVRAIAALCLLLPVCGGLAVLGFETLAMQINLIAVAGSPFLLFGAALTASPTSPGAPAPVRRSGWTVLRNLPQALLVVLGWVAGYPFLGITLEEPVTLLLHASLNLVTLVLMYQVIRRQALQRRAARRAAERATLEAQARFTESERERVRTGQFLAMIAHELKTPLSVLRIALDKATISTQMLRHARQAVENIDQLVERSTHAVRLQQVDLTATMSEVSIDAELQHLRSSKAWPARVVAPRCAEVGMIVTDRVLLGVILGNMVDNALKYSVAGSPVTLDARLAARGGAPGLAIVCRNAVGAAGLPDAARIFTKYYRSSGARREGGMGLGMHLSHALAERIGGSLAYRAEGSDAVFELWLPAVGET